MVVKLERLAAAVCWSSANNCLVPVYRPAPVVREFPIGPGCGCKQKNKISELSVMEFHSWRS